jgi:hypothetical protein
MKFVPSERSIGIDKPRPTRVTLAEFTKLQLLSTTDDHPSSTFAPNPEKNVAMRVAAAMSKARAS